MVTGYAARTGLPTITEALAGILTERAHMGATPSSIRGYTSAVRAVEDLRWIAPAVATLHKRVAAGAASAGPQPYLPHQLELVRLSHLSSAPSRVPTCLICNYVLAEAASMVSLAMTMRQYPQQVAMGTYRYTESILASSAVYQIGIASMSNCTFLVLTCTL